jgi:hypothetical protein
MKGGPAASQLEKPTASPHHDKGSELHVMAEPIVLPHSYPVG